MNTKRLEDINTYSIVSGLKNQPLKCLILYIQFPYSYSSDVFYDNSEVNP